MPMAEGAPKLTSIALPPRSSMESLFTGGTIPGFSPGPMTLVSNFFSDNYPDNDCRSFSQLLAGAMGSPITPPSENLGEKEGESDKEKELGFKQNRPMNLVVGQQPGMFMGAPGLSPGITPSGFLSPGFFSPLQSPFGMSHQQALAQVTAQAALSQSFMQMQQPEQQPYVEPLPQQQPITTIQQVDTVSAMSEPESSAMESSEVTQSDRKLVPLSVADKPANDGYNWRKYGQKQVKGSEYPRSYYRCTHQTCRVTKKVERNLQGKITEIIYKGQHNHDLPEPSKRTRNNTDTKPSLSSQASPEVSLPSEPERRRSFEVSHLGPGRDQGLLQLTSVPLQNPTDGLEIIEVESSQNQNNDEPYPKRRNIEVDPSQKSAMHKTITEPKIVLQTRSEVDLLDDGYKWRKYGQKVVKGNPHPRSYYKCTFTGCNVRKHVERSSTDPKAVITTYEGKHGHDVPAPRKSSHSTAELKPQKATDKKRATNQEMEFNYDQRHLLQLKEEHIQA